MDRVEKGTRGWPEDGGLCCYCNHVLILVFGKYLMSIFTDTGELVDLSMYFMRILALGYIAMAVTQVLSGTMRGAGDTLTPMWISLMTTILIRVPIAYGLAYLTRSPEYPTGRPESSLYFFIDCLGFRVCH